MAKVDKVKHVSLYEYDWVNHRQKGLDLGIVDEVRRDDTLLTELEQQNNLLREDEHGPAFENQGLQTRVDITHKRLTVECLPVLCRFFRICFIWRS